MNTLAQGFDQKEEKDFDIDFFDLSIGKAYIDKRFLQLLKFDGSDTKQEDIDNKLLFKKLMIESLECFPFKKNKLTREIILCKSVDEMIESFSLVIKEKFNERSINGDNACKDIIKMVETIFIERIATYLTTGFVEIQKTLQTFIMKKTRGEDSHLKTELEKGKIKDLIPRLNEYKNGLIEVKREQMIVKLFGIEKASQYYPKMKFQRVAGNTKIKIGLLARIREIISKN